MAVRACNRYELPGLGAGFGDRTTVPSHLSVVRISVADGRQQRILYRGDTGWLLNGGPVIRAAGERGFNGWIAHRRLVRLHPSSGAIIAEAW